VALARKHLGAALDTFSRLGAQPWADRAGTELRATGAPRIEPKNFEPGPLTAQERAIAQLAASGLTNKQIGEKLFLSHRTVGTHLYRVFPKLGITARAALRDALTAL
jgi:DNA-binding NarL/FixJ family response regulator